jgi:UDP-N-acetylmuramate--alanine ligase
MRIPVPDDVPSAVELGRVHYVGIGGAGLSGLARLMLARGVAVSGSDAQESPTLDALRALGATCYVGHRAEQVKDVDTVVVSTAIDESNPEVVAARDLGLRLWPRAAAVVSVMIGRTVMAVTGTHGKSTTSSMLAVALTEAGADPSYALGADLAATGSNAHEGGGDEFVVEADESDGAFLAYSPTVAVVTNVEADHLDVYGTADAYRAAFDTFLERIVPGGCLVGCIDDPGAASLVDQARRAGLDTMAVGFGAAADLRGVDVTIEGARTSCVVERDGRRLGPLRIALPGRHYLLDALLALAAGLRRGYPFDALATGLARYAGSRRRMELKGEAAEVRVFDSYAHHPTEIAADLAAARSLAGAGRVVVCFQPHLVSRTKVFGAEMGRSLGAADVAIVADIYLAREQAEEGVDGRIIADAVPLPADRVRYVPNRADLATEVVAVARPGDLVLTLGAGDITTVGPQVLALLAESGGPPADV